MVKQKNISELKLIEFVENCPIYNNHHGDYIRRSQFGIYSRVIIIVGATVIFCTDFFLFSFFLKIQISFSHHGRGVEKQMSDSW